MVARLIALVLASAAVLAACGGGNDSDDEAPVNREPVTAASMDALLDRLPSDTIEIDTLDLAAIKRKLGLPGDRDPTIESDRPPAQRKLSTAAFSIANKLAGDPDAKVEPIADLGLVTAAVEVATFALDVMVLLATPQPRAEIERALAKGGFESVAENRFSIPPVDSPAYRNRGQLLHVAIGEGFVAAASTPELARDVVATAEPAPGLALARRHLDRVRGDERALRAVAGIDDEDADAECIRLIAGGNLIDSKGAEDVVLLLSETPDRRRIVVGNRGLTRDTTIDDYALRSASIEGRTVRLKVAGAKRPSTIVNGVDAAGSPPGWLYRCNGLALRPKTNPQAGTADDAGGNFVEERVNGFIASRSSARTRVKVRCPVDHGEPNATIRCTGTRSDGADTFQYQFAVTFDASSLSDVAAVKITSTNDTTKTILDGG